jgi:hypothetical protein
MTHFDESTDIRTLYFNITVDDRFIDGQANMTVYFGHHVNKTEYNISGYLYFEDSGCNPSTPTPTDIVTTPCDCPMTGNSDTTQTTTAACQTLPSGSTLTYLDLPGSVFTVVVSLLLSAP